MTPTPSVNFAYLAHHDARLVALATQAEQHFAGDPTVTLFKLRQFAEVLAQRAAAKVGLLAAPQEGQQQLIERLFDKHAIGATQRSIFHDLRRVGNAAVHEGNLTIYPPGTLLLAMYGEGKTRGMVAELGIEAATNQAVAAICLEGSAAATKSLVRLALDRNYAEIRGLSMGGVQPNLNLEKVRGLAVPLCPAEEALVLERAVEAALDRTTLLLGVVEGQTTALDTLDSAVLAKAFRGALVPQDPNDEPAEAMLARLRAANGAASNGTNATTSKKGRTKRARGLPLG